MLTFSVVSVMLNCGECFRCSGLVSLCQSWRYKPREKSLPVYKSLLSPSPRRNAALQKRNSTAMSPLLLRYVSGVWEAGVSIDWCIIVTIKCTSFDQFRILVQFLPHYMVNFRTPLLSGQLAISRGGRLIEVWL